MEEDNESVPTGEGNWELGDICSALFYKTGCIGYYNLANRLTEPAAVFDNNFSSEQEPTM